MRNLKITTLACAVALTMTSPAHGAMIIGQVAPDDAVANECGGGQGTDLLQPSVTAGANLYGARAAGTITAWSTNASDTPGQSYTLKVFRRTIDPDVFRVIARSGPHELIPGLNTFPAAVPVSPGDLIGLHAGGAANACTFVVPGDAVLESSTDLLEGESGTFAPKVDSRLNLSALLIPTNSFSLGRVVRDRRTGAATLEIVVPNPGSVTLAGRGLKTRRATKKVAVAATVRFGIAAAGARKRKLNRKGRVSVPLSVTFTPTGGDPATQAIRVKLKKKR